MSAHGALRDVSKSLVSRYRPLGVCFLMPFAIREVIRKKRAIAASRTPFRDGHARTC